MSIKPKGQKGFILIVVLVVIILSSMVALSLMFRLQAEQSSFSASAGSEQAWYTAISGIQQAMQLASTPGDAANWQNNPGALHHQLVYDDGSDKWYFTVYCPPASNEEQQIRNGMVDENSKLNLNKATAGMLQKCTTLPPQIIEAIAPGSSGVTNSSVVDPNFFGISVRQQFTTMDDLLKLPGMLPGMIYGEDANHNYHLDPNEDDGVLSFPPDDGDGQLFLGLQEVATVFSYELNQTREGLPRLQLNSVSITNVQDAAFPEKTLQYLQLAAENKILFTNAADLLEATNKFKDAQGKEVVVDSGITDKELPLALDRFTASFDQRLVGRLNINTASTKVLMALPGLSPEKAEAIVSTREGLAPEIRQSIAWLFQEGIVDAALFKQLAPLITTRSLQFRFNVVGYALPSGRYRVFEVVIDTADKQPQIMYLRDISRFGLPFALPSDQETTDVGQSKV